MKKWYHKLVSEKVAIYPLATFRVIFGLLMFISTARFIYLGWIEDHYIQNRFQFKYYGFEWVSLLPPFWMYTLHWTLLVASLLVLLGLYYRFASIILFLTFTYLELIDLTYYLNHYYFVSLISGLLMFLPAHRWFSLDVIRKPEIQTAETTAWHINILKFQILILYCYAGLAKINYPWLIEALPMKIWLPANDKIPLLGSLFEQPWAPYLFSWAGMLYDTFIVFFLMYRPTRIWAYVAVVVFHSIVGILFQIGVFPVVMIGITLLFFSDKWHLKWQSAVSRLTGLSTLSHSTSNSQTTDIHHQTFNFQLQTSRTGRQIRNTLLITYALFQLLFPWRYLLYPGSLFWREEGYRFSWRVMLMEKAGTATFYVKDSESGKEGMVDNGEFLNAHQEKQMAFEPDMILQFAHFLGDYYEEKGVHKPQVRVEAYVTLNARPSRLFIDPEVNLIQIKDGWAPKSWILD